jgi:hypothetical protein
MGRHDAGYVVPDIERIRATLHQTIAASAATAVPSAGDACN